MAWTMRRPARLLRAELNDGTLVAELRPLLSPSPEAAVPGIDKRERMLAGVGNDVRQALRLLRFNPGFAAVAILSLALGIGANTAIFELIDAVLMRTLPVPSPQQLADIQEIHGGRDRQHGCTAERILLRHLGAVAAAAEGLLRHRRMEHGAV